MHDSLRRVATRATFYSVLRQEQMQKLVTQRLGENRNYELDLSRRYFAFRSEQGELRATPHFVASIALEPHTYLWSYAEHFRGMREFSPVPDELEAFALQHKLPDFAHHAHPYEIDGDDPAAALAALGHLLGQAAIEATRRSDHFYSLTREPQLGGLFVVLLENLDGAPKTVTFEDLLPHLGTFLRRTKDVDWEFGGLAELAGWRFERHEVSGEFPMWRVTDQQGRLLLIKVVENPDTGKQSLQADVQMHPSGE